MKIRLILCLVSVTRCMNNGNGKNIVKYLFRYCLLVNKFLQTVYFSLQKYKSIGL